jgi:hypothetical protein
MCVSNDAPNGLLLSVRNLKGVRVHERFEPMQSGAKAVKFDKEPTQANVVKYKKGIEPAVSFGAGVSTYELNEALEPSGMFAVGPANGKSAAT